MMTEPLVHSVFQDVLFPVDLKLASNDEDNNLRLNQLKRYVPLLDIDVRQHTLVVFDLETTGLDYDADRVIEIGAIKLQNGEVVDEFSSLVAVDMELTEDIVKLTGITPDMLEGQPLIEPVLQDFLKFIHGSILVAHNAEFDLNMIRAAYGRIGILLEWPCFCTLKMSRELLPDLENRKLDTLAEYYGQTFEARHRSIGDVKVTVGVLQGMFNAEAQHLQRWNDMQPYRIT